MTEVRLPRDTTRLVLPVPELAGTFPGACVVLLAPFLPVGRVDEGVLEELRDLFADVVPFGFVLGEATRFPSGAAYLPPQPAAPFRAITHALRRAFPEVSATAQPFDEAVPHLALPDDPADDPAGAVATPLAAHAREAQLRDPDGAVLATFAFGTSAA